VLKALRLNLAAGDALAVPARAHGDDGQREPPFSLSAVAHLYVDKSSDSLLVLEADGNLPRPRGPLVNGDRQQESLVGCDQVRPVNRELPFEAEVPLHPIVRVLREDRDK